MHATNKAHKPVRPFRSVPRILSTRSLLVRKDDTYRRRPEEANHYSTVHRGGPRVEADKRMTWASKTPQCPLGGCRKQGIIEAGPTKSIL